MTGEGVAGSGRGPDSIAGERDALIRAAITGRHPMAATYDGRERLFVLTCRDGTKKGIYVC
jgi:hypothetical protein